MNTTCHREVTGENLQQLQVWRARALELMPYFAALLFSLRTLDVDGLGTMAVDRHLRLYIDFEAVSQWPAEKCAQVLLHECGHIFGDHAALAEDLDITPSHHKVWNLATDAAINDDLIAAGLTQLLDGVQPQDFGQQPFRTPVEYYQALLDLVDKQQGSESGPDQGPAGGEAGGGEGEPFRGCGSVSGGEQAPVELEPGDDCHGVAAAASTVEIDLVRLRTALAIREHESQHPGSVPGGLTEITKRFFSVSQTSWRSQLSMCLRRGVRLSRGAVKRSYRRRDRRSHARMLPGSTKRSLVRPGWVAPNPSIHVVRDTSGSMGAKELQAVTREVAAISRSLRIRGDDLLITDCDVHTATTRAWNGIDSIREVTGRGGTDMGKAVEQVLAERAKNPPSALVVITDGVTPWLDEHPEPGVSIIACIVCSETDFSARAANVPDFITAIRVDPDS